MGYTTFTFYSTEYLGTAIAEADYPRYDLLASAFIDRVTFGRAATETDVDLIEKIKMATCMVADAMKVIADAGGEDAITSESVGRHSVSYASNSSKTKTNGEKLEDAAAFWMAETGLMFKGFAAGEYGARI
jgi:hypothetical protein